MINIGDTETEDTVLASRVHSIIIIITKETVPIIGSSYSQELLS